MHRRNRIERIQDFIAYTMLACAVIVIMLPLAWVFSTSIKSNYEIYANPPYWIPLAPTLESYKKVLLASSIPQALVNSFIIGFATAFISLLLGGSSGYAFARFKFRGNRFFSLFMLISQMFPLTVLMIPLYYMGNEAGLVDTKLGLAVAHLVIAMPLVTWMAKGYFKGIPREIEEAATVDGCNTIKTIYHIILPLMRPALAATGVYAFISSWNEFVLANVITRSMTSRTVPIALNDFSTFFKVNWGETMAAALIITIPVVVIFMAIQKQFVEGLVGGAVKG